MKLKGLTKLALSGVALAAVAATLGTSTYAWYISNDTATINNASGSTAAAVTDGSIYAATTAQKGNNIWKNTIDLVEDTDCIVPSGGLNPYTKATATATTNYGAVETLATNPTVGNFVDKKGVEVTTQTDAYIAINFWIMSRGADATVQPQFSVKNTTTADDSLRQTVYALGHTPTGVGTTIGTSKFMIDATFALRMEITYTADGSDTALAALDDVDVAAVAGVTAAKTGMYKGGDANLYYNDNVNGVNLYGCSATNGAGYSTSVEQGAVASFGTLNLTAGTAYHVEVKIWLEGTDAECFDSACGQDFDFTFSYVKQNS